MKPKCIVVDLDNTFALHPDNPKRTDHSNCIDDVVNEDLLELLDHNIFNSFPIIFLTKRSTKYQIETIAFIQKHFNGESYLIMRDDSDKDDSPTFKRKKLIKLMKHFDIVKCFEDDDRNIEMMQDLGLNVFDVKKFKEV